MSFSEEQIKRIQDKLQQLLRQYAVLQKENTQLKQQLDQANLHAVQHQKNVDDLRQQVTVLKLNAGDMAEVDKKDIEKRINSYLKEIDRCIALLSE